MNDFNQNSNKNPKKQITRFIILPLKKPLAKFLISDFRFLYALLSDEQRKQQDALYETYFLKSDGRKKRNLILLRKKEPWLSKLGSLFEDLQREIVNGAFMYMLPGYRIKVIFREDYRAVYYTNRRNLPEHLKGYNQKKYSLVKFTFSVQPDEENRKGIPHSLKNSHLEFANNLFLFSLFKFIEKQKTIQHGIDIACEIIGLNENDIKKTTLKRYYFKWKKTGADLVVIPNTYDKKISDIGIFAIANKRFSENYSYSKIANTTGISKAKVIAICKNPDILRFYHDVKRYSDNYIHYFIRKKTTF